MEILNVSQAKPKIGQLIERALAGESVVIRKGDRMVQLIEFVIPEPIPERTIGYFRRQPADYRDANLLPSSTKPVR